MTEEIIKSNESVETKEIQQVEQVKAPAKLSEYDKLERKLHKYDKEFVEEFLRNIKSIVPLIVTGKNESKKTFLTNEEIANLLEYANFGIDISPKAGMLYYFSRGGQFGFLTPRAIIEMLAKVGVIATVEIVCSNDQFSMGLVNNKHRIDHAISLPRGDAVGVYGILRRGDEVIAIEVMDMMEIEKIRKIADNFRKSAVWELHTGEMMKKTMLKRIAKRTPLLDHNIKQALEIDSKEYSQPEPAEKINNVAVTTQPERI